MPRPMAALLMLALLTAGCSGVNPLYSGGDAPQDIDPDTAAGGIAGRPLMSEVSALAVEPADGGVIVRATGLPPTQGYWDATLVATPRAPVDGVMTFSFVAIPPATAHAPGTDQSREIEAATFLSSYQLGSIREIVVKGALNQRSSRR